MSQYQTGMRTPPDWIPEARRLKQSGMTYKEVAQKVGVTPQRVFQAFKIHGQPSDGACSKCGKTSNRLHCHHTNYETNEFILVCPSCHPKMHGPEKKRGHEFRRRNLRLHNERLEQERKSKGLIMLQVACKCRRETKGMSISDAANEIGISESEYAGFEQQPIGSVTQTLRQILLWLLS